MREWIGRIWRMEMGRLGWEKQTEEEIEKTTARPATEDRNQRMERESRTGGWSLDNGGGGWKKERNEADERSKILQ